MTVSIPKNPATSTTKAAPTAVPAATSAATFSAPTAPPQAPAAPAKAPKAKKPKVEAPVSTANTVPTPPIPPPTKPVAPPKTQTITKGAFKKASFLVAKSTSKTDKANFKPGLFKRVQLFIVASTLRLVATVAFMRNDLTAVLGGNAITPANRKVAEELLGHVFQHLMVIARALKVKIPSLSRGKAVGSTFDAFMAFDRAVHKLYGIVSGTLDGTSLSNPEVTALLSEYVLEALNAAILLSKVLAQKSAAEVVTDHAQYLSKTYPTAFVTPEPKVLTPEEQALKNEKAAKLKAALKAGMEKKAAEKAAAKPAETKA